MSRQPNALGVGHIYQPMPVWQVQSGAPLSASKASTCLMQAATTQGVWLVDGKGR